MWLQVWTGVCDITVEEKGLTAFSSCRGALSPCPRAGLVSARCQFVLAEHHTSQGKRVGSWSWGWLRSSAEDSWNTVCLCVEISFLDCFFSLGAASPLRCLKPPPKWLAEEGLGEIKRWERETVYWFSCISLLIANSCHGTSWFQHVHRHHRVLLLGVTNTFWLAGDAVNCFTNPLPLQPVGLILVAIFALLFLIQDLNVVSWRIWFAHI